MGMDIAASASRVYVKYYRCATHTGGPADDGGPARVNAALRPRRPGRYGSEAIATSITTRLLAGRLMSVRHNAFWSRCANDA